MKILLNAAFLYILFIFKLNINAQTSCNSGLVFKNASFDVCVFAINPETISKFNIQQNISALNYSEFIEELLLNNNEITFATNACISDVKGDPMGLMISDGVEIKPINLNDGQGNFYLKPNGILCFYRDSVDIMESSKFVNNKDIKIAVQSGPLMLYDGKINSQFNPKSNNKYIRSGVGIFKDTKDSSYLVIAKSNIPVSFYEFAILFKEKYNCLNALVLESQLSIMYHKTFPVDVSNNDYQIGNYLLYHDSISINKNNRSEIKMIKTNSGVYVIPIILNGVLKINFIFDSGASDISISPDVALTLMRTGTIEKNDFIGTQTYKFANGQTATSEVFYLKEVQIGNKTMKRVKASIADNIDAPMLLGQSVLQRLGKFTIDNKNHVLIIE